MEVNFQKNFLDLYMAFNVHNDLTFDLDHVFDNHIAASEEYHAVSRAARERYHLASEVPF